MRSSNPFSRYDSSADGRQTARGYIDDESQNYGDRHAGPSTGSPGSVSGQVPGPQPIFTDYPTVHGPSDNSAPAAVGAPPAASLTGGAAGSPANGPQVGGTGGFGFTNLASYLYANPMGQGAGSGYAPTPTGFKPGDYNSQINGFAPNAQYTAGMAGVDNALNGAYGRVAPASPPAAGAQTSGSMGAPPAPAAPRDPNNPNRPRYANQTQPGSYSNLRSLVMGNGY